MGEPQIDQVEEPQTDQDEWDDDDWEYKPPPGPTPNQRRERWAEEGDIQALLDEIKAKPASFYDIARMLSYVERAVRVSATSDPEAHAKQTLARLVGFNTYLLIRLQTYVANRIAGNDKQLRDASRVAQADFPADVIEKFLPRLVDLQRCLGETLLIQVQVSRLWTLTRARRRSGTSAPRRSRRSLDGSGRRKPQARRDRRRITPTARPTPPRTAWSRDPTGAVSMGETPPRPRPDREARWREIERKLDAVSGALARQGSVASRLTPAGTRVYSVRYMEAGDGRRRQRTIYLGPDPELARRAAEMIREVRAWAREAEGSARLGAASRIFLRHLLAVCSPSSEGTPGRPPGA